MLAEEEKKEKKEEKQRWRLWSLMVEPLPGSWVRIVVIDVVMMMGWMGFVVVVVVGW